MNRLIEWDRALFEFINGHNSPFWDEFMSLISSKWAWIPLYLMLFIYMYFKLGIRQTLGIVVAVGFVILLSDRISAGLFKPFFMRLRPCHDSGLWTEAVHLVDSHCGGKYGFISSHATNFFAWGTFLGLVLPGNRKIWLVSFFICSLAVAYSRVYLGVHYPLDVICGAIVGTGLGILVYFVFQKLSKQFEK